MNKDFASLSYDLHQRNYENDALNKVSPSWKEKDTIDYWRHERMYQLIDPLIVSYPEATWLTLGDGRYGTDANYLLSKKIKDVLATDISDTFLMKAKEEGFINDYKVENAEKLSFADQSFDFVLCKESYHHFPRPMVALYEMIRVAKKGVILIEPNDNNVLSFSGFNKNVLLVNSLRVIKNTIKKLLGRQPYYEYGGYETVGNYVYTISEREIEKVALGLNFEMVAFKGFNDVYIEGVELEKSTQDSALFQRLKKEIAQADRKVQSGKALPGLLLAVILKERPTVDCIQSMECKSISIRQLPRNPYNTS
jgi:ubiquinone/menaquinone biosynthesis C-methylase UbiE